MKFNEKLEQRMKQKNMTTKEFAKMLYNYGLDSDLCNSPNNKASFDSHVRKVQKWIAGNTEPASIDDLKKICDILDCDFNYLLGDAPIANLSNKRVADWLGLDEITVSSIKNYNDSEKELLLKLVSSQKQDNLLKLLQSIYNYSLWSHHANIELDVVGADISEKYEINERLTGFSHTPGNTLPDISKKMLKYSVVSTLDEVLSDTYNDYTNEGNLLLKQRLLELSDMEKKRVSYLLERRKTLKEHGEDLSFDELNLLLGGNWNDELFPTEQDIHKRIDEKYRRLYDLHKE